MVVKKSGLEQGLTGLEKIGGLTTLLRQTNLLQTRVITVEERPREFYFSVIASNKNINFSRAKNIYVFMVDFGLFGFKE